MEIASQISLPVPHITQHHAWDCGLASCKMVLSFLHKSFEDFNEVCARLEFGRSVWTIDLAYILQHYGVKHCLYTITLGVDPGYDKQHYYKSTISVDEIRVNEKFCNAEEVDVIVEKRSVTLDGIFRHLSNNNIIIVLVDWSYLCCIQCDNKCLHFLNSVVGSRTGCCHRYQGHYIVLCGYNKQEGTILYQNPGHDEDLCCCTISTFEKARKSYGTDEDILYIYCNGDSDR